MIEEVHHMRGPRAYHFFVVSLNLSHNPISCSTSFARGRSDYEQSLSLWGSARLLTQWYGMYALHDSAHDHDRECPVEMR